MWQHCVHSAQQTIVFFNHIELVAASTQAGDCLAEVLWQYLELAVRLLTADEDLADCFNATIKFC